MRKKLKDISIIETGFVFRNKIEYTPSGNINLLNMEAISSAGDIELVLEDTKRAVADGIKDVQIIKTNDILFKAKGLNNTAVLVKKIPKDTTVTASCHIIRITNKDLLPEFVCSWLNSSTAKKHFSKGAGQATGVTIANVSKGTLETLEIPILPIKQQKLIADIEACAKHEHEIRINLADKKKQLHRTILERELQKY